MTVSDRVLFRDRTALSPREMEALTLAAEGLTVDETATRLWLGSQTVKLHRTNLMRKLGASNMPHAVALAYQRKLIRIDEAPANVLIDGIEYVRAGPPPEGIA